MDSYEKLCTDIFILIPLSKSRKLHFYHILDNKTVPITQSNTYITLCTSADSIDKLIYLCNSANPRKIITSNREKNDANRGEISCKHSVIYGHTTGRL